MKMRIILAVIAMLCVSSLAFGDEIDNRFQKARKYLQGEKLNITTTVEQAFAQDAILMSGEGVPKKGTTGGQKRLTAITAAKVVAQRRLAELLEGVAIVSETTVKDSELASDVIKSAVIGFIKGAQVVIQDYNEKEETAMVILKVGVTGPKSFAAVMYEKILTEPKIKKDLEKPAFTPPADVPPPTPAAAGGYDGLIIDATDYSFRPALINRIFNPKGEVLYDPAKISQKVLVEQGCGEYTNSVDKARAALGKRGVKNPLVVKASGTVSPSDLQVADATAVQIFSANQASGFMADARVAFVLK
ncbi:MAG: hypothetical protein HYV06_02715 [Deltaproteobacteria bacterium]|nr:hypothetical protein [Deltaproteobacteria bacterium]